MTLVIFLSVVYIIGFYVAAEISEDQPVEDALGIGLLWPLFLIKVIALCLGIVIVRGFAQLFRKWE